MSKQKTKKGESSKTQVSKGYLRVFKAVILLTVCIALLCIFYLHYSVFGEDILSKPYHDYSLLDLANLIIIIVGALYASLLIIFPTFIGIILGISKIISYIPVGERFLIRNLGSICFLTIFTIFTLKFSKQFIISNEALLTSLGAVVLFWYGYKKYERDKEIEMIGKFSERYTTIIETLKKLKINENGALGAYYQLINLWYEEYHLYINGYLSDSLWNEWHSWIRTDIVALLGILPSIQKEVIVPGVNIPMLLFALNYQLSLSQHEKNSSWIQFLEFMHHEIYAIASSNLLLEITGSEEKRMLELCLVELKKMDSSINNRATLYELYESNLKLDELKKRST